MILNKKYSIHKLTQYIVLLLMVLLPVQLKAQTATTDTVTSPKVNYSYPKKYEIADITVTGAESYDDYVVIGFSGLTKGQIITIPGDEVTTAVKRFWKQGLFSDVSITLTKTVGNQAWINIDLTEQPRVSDVRFQGLKKSDKDDLSGKIGIAKGSQVNQDIIDRAKKIIKNFFDE
ncbi:MAG: outer membrane protein assembly factor BamA, partial [Coprobacter sp.]|nr:outer membrane protein assembly factor BamA [Coprobacter sp.]